MTTKSTICILDDEPIVGDRLKPEMEDDGYEVEVFTDRSNGWLSGVSIFSSPI